VTHVNERGRFPVNDKSKDKGNTNEKLTFVFNTKGLQLEIVNGVKGLQRIIRQLPATAIADLSYSLSSVQSLVLLPEDTVT
jgi:hypothetical protein